MYKIFRTLGTPTEAIWPGVNQLKDYKGTLPSLKSQTASDSAPTMDSHDLDLLSTQSKFMIPAKEFQQKRLFCIHFSTRDSRFNIRRIMKISEREIESI